MRSISYIEDDWYPTFSIDECPNEYQQTVEVSEEFIERYRRVLSDFENMQRELQAMFRIVYDGDEKL